MEEYEGFLYAPAAYDVNKIGFILIDDKPDNSQDSMDIDHELTPEVPPQKSTTATSQAGVSVASRTCHICDRVFKNRSNVKRHINDVHSEKSRQCKICDGFFDDKYLLSLHLRDHPNFSCDKCGKELKTKHEMTFHLTIHQELIFDLDDLLGM